MKSLLITLILFFNFHLNAMTPPQILSVKTFTDWKYCERLRSLEIKSSKLEDQILSLETQLHQSINNGNIEGLAGKFKKIDDLLSEQKLVNKKILKLIQQPTAQAQVFLESSLILEKDQLKALYGQYNVTPFKELHAPYIRIPAGKVLVDLIGGVACDALDTNNLNESARIATELLLIN